ncbi:hypothetical protein HaLaN_32923, partial [Haematococcus lacustris]
MLASWLWTA